MELALTPSARHEYRLERAYASEDGAETTVIVEDWVVELAKDDPHRATFRRRLVAVEVDGRALPRPSGEWTVSSARIDYDGTVSSRAWLSEDGLVFARHFRPLEVRLSGGSPSPGAEWKVREGAQPDGTLPAATWTYRVAGTAAGRITLEASFAEEGDGGAPHGEGTIVLDAKSHWPVSAELWLRPVSQPLDEEAVPCTLRLKLARR